MRRLPARPQCLNGSNASPSPPSPVPPVPRVRSDSHSQIHSPPCDNHFYYMCRPITGFSRHCCESLHDAAPEHDIPNAALFNVPGDVSSSSSEISAAPPKMHSKLTRNVCTQQRRSVLTVLSFADPVHLGTSARIATTQRHTEMDARYVTRMRSLPEKENRALYDLPGSQCN
jgi:hypothetical protein